MPHAHILLLNAVCGSTVIRYTNSTLTRSALFAVYMRTSLCICCILCQYQASMQEFHSQ